MSKRERIALRFEKGALRPADDLSVERLRKRGYKVGDVVMAELVQARNPAFNRLAHALGGLIAENIEAFDHMDSHDTLKRLQLESGVGCDEIAIRAPGLGMVMHRQARSLSFASMSEDEFHEVMSGLCKYVAKVYWPSLTAEQIEGMAEAWISEGA